MCFFLSLNLIREENISNTVPVLCNFLLCKEKTCFHYIRVI